MGLFDFLKGKKKPETMPVEPPPPPPAPTDYTPLIRLAEILTNGHEDTVAEIAQLVHDYSSFCSAHREWCDEILEGLDDRHEQLLVAFAYWLTGYDTDRNFGNYIDWKEETSEIVWGLEPVIESLAYPLGVKDIPFTGEEFTDKALQVIDGHFKKQGYTLVSLDTGGDCYHLFIVPANRYEELVTLGNGVNFRFFNQYV